MAKELNTLKFPETFKVISLIKSTKRCDPIELINFIGKNILHYDTAVITVQYNDRILNKFSTENCQLQALLDKTLLPHTYNLLIRTNSSSNLEDIICHEMVHFDQYERGDLSIKKSDDSISFIWKNEEYNTSIEYYNRPWEKEARSLQSKYWKQYKEYKKKKEA